MKHILCFQPVLRRVGKHSLGDVDRFGLTEWHRGRGELSFEEVPERTPVDFPVGIAQDAEELGAGEIIQFERLLVRQAESSVFGLHDTSEAWYPRDDKSSGLKAALAFPDIYARGIIHFMNGNNGVRREIMRQEEVPARGCDSRRETLRMARGHPTARDLAQRLLNNVEGKLGLYPAEGNRRSDSSAWIRAGAGRERPGL